MVRAATPSDVTSAIELTRSRARKGATRASDVTCAVWFARFRANAVANACASISTEFGAAWSWISFNEFEELAITFNELKELAERSSITANEFEGLAKTTRGGCPCVIFSRCSLATKYTRFTSEA